MNNLIQTISFLFSQEGILQKILMVVWLICTVAFYSTVTYVLGLVIVDTIKQTITKISFK